jgi:flavin reductase (DIM6/NTAB) family NADH-FMN oxidoreductase RutF
MNGNEYENLVTLEKGVPIWDNFFTVSPLVLVGGRDASQEYNLAPKHMAFPLGWENYFAFVCTPSHTTYQNIKRDGEFTVTYPRPTQVIFTSLSATPRDDDNFKPSLLALPTFPAELIDGPFVQDGYVFLECRLNRIIDGFGRNSLIIGEIIAAHVHKEALRASDRDDGALIFNAPLLAFLEPGRFARIEQTFAFPFPTDFKR